MRSLDYESEEILIAIMGRVPLVLLRVRPLRFFKALRDELERAAVLGDRTHNLVGDTTMCRLCPRALPMNEAPTSAAWSSGTRANLPPEGKHHIAGAAP
jgi:hypothetical protein